VVDLDVYHAYPLTNDTVFQILFGFYSKKTGVMLKAAAGAQEFWEGGVNTTFMLKVGGHQPKLCEEETEATAQRGIPFTFWDKVLWV
jgi:hypothetical protein